MGLAVIVPWCHTDPDRAAALEWVLWRWRTEAPDVPLTVARWRAEPWVKAEAVMPHVAALEPGTVVIVSDADVWCDQTLEAAQAVADGAGWAVPHFYVRRLTRDASRQVYGGTRPQDLDAMQLEERAYIGVEGGGIVVASREALLEAPFDSRFKGWGGEDQALGYALRALNGDPWRGLAHCWHLWHPPQPRAARHLGNPDNDQLRQRYLAAEFQPDTMRAILAEDTEALWRSACASPSTGPE